MAGATASALAVLTLKHLLSLPTEVSFRFSYCTLKFGRCSAETLRSKAKLIYDDCILPGYGLHSLVNRIQTFRGNQLWRLSRIEISGRYPQTQLHTRKEVNPQAHSCDILEVKSSITATQPLLVAERSKAWVCGRRLAGIAG